MKSEDKMVNLYRRVYSKPGCANALKASGIISVISVALIFAYVLFALVFSGEYLDALRLTLFAAVPFVAISILRVCIDFERPYEVFDIPEFEALKSERKSGEPNEIEFLIKVLSTSLLTKSILFILPSRLGCAL